MFRVKLETGGKTYTARAENIEDALAKMKLDWMDIKLKGTLTVQEGKKIQEHFFNLIQLRRILTNKLARALWAKNLKFLLKETEPAKQ